jgi:non-homologous end joining protein Ku
MAPRANWKGFLRLSLVTCPVALYPATSDSEKISFNQINRNTGHRIKYMKVVEGRPYARLDDGKRFCGSAAKGRQLRRLSF